MEIRRAKTHVFSVGNFAFRLELLLFLMIPVRYLRQTEQSPVYRPIKVLGNFPIRVHISLCRYQSIADFSYHLAGFVFYFFVTLMLKAQACV